MKNIRFQLIIGLLFIALGVFLGYDPFMRYLQERKALQNNSSVSAQPEPIPATPKPAVRVEGKPVRITLKRIGIDVAIADGYYNQQNKSWTLSLDKAHYAIMTVMPNNQGGNTFIYGHNRPAVFSKLLNVRPGDTAVVKTSNGKTFTYTYRSMRETNPNDDSLFSYQGAPILTLQTCSGLWYQNRSLYTFTLSEVK